MTRYKVTVRTYSTETDKPLTKRHEIIDTERDRMYRDAKNPEEIKTIYETFWNLAPRVSEKEEIVVVKNVHKLEK